MEETLSTLEYAMRAKSIRNKPEVNQRMSRNSLLKEYVYEIERLKADVMAAREKNGIFFSEENWNKISVEHELKVSEAEESKKQVDIVESQLRAVREEFEQSIGLLMKTDGELKATKHRLENREIELVLKDGQLTVVKGALEEEVVVRRAHQDTEGQLDGVAGKLKQVARASINDLGIMFEKLGQFCLSFLFSSPDLIDRSNQLRAWVKFQGCIYPHEIHIHRIPEPINQARQLCPSHQPTRKKVSHGNRSMANQRARAPFCSFGRNQRPNRQNQQITAACH